MVSYPGYWRNTELVVTWPEQSARLEVPRFASARKAKFAVLQIRMPAAGFCEWQAREDARYPSGPAPRRLALVNSRARSLVALLLITLGVRLKNARRRTNEQRAVIMRAQYRITVGQTQEGSHQAPHGARSKLDVLKAALLTLLVLSSVIGVFLAAFVLGSIIASVLLILIAISAIALVVRRFVLKFRRGQTTRAHD